MADHLIPITIGVTGHRDLRADDLPALERAVRTQLTRLRSRYPFSPFLVLSPLAEGADRLVARIALEFNARLVVPLPFSRAEYEKDFALPESRAAFAGLLQQASRVFEVGLVPGATAEDIASAGPNRDRQYEAVGTWVARRSQILFALWDSSNRGLTGETAAVVDVRLGKKAGGQMRSGKLLDPPECGPVIQVVTPRQSHPLAEGTAFAIRTIVPPSWGTDGNAERTWAAVLARIEGFNSMVSRADSRLQSGIAASRTCGVKEAELPDGCRVLLDRYTAADALALRFRARRRWSLRALFALAVAGVGTFVVYNDLFREASWAPWMLFMYLGIFAAGYLVFLVSRHLRFEENALEYRALAEGLRVQLYWMLAGVDANADDYYLRKQRTELDWILAAIRNCCLPIPAVAPGAARRSISAVGLVRDTWVRGQADYFDMAWHRNDQGVGRLDRYVRALVAAALAASVLLVVAHTRIVEHHWLHSLFTICVVLLLAVAGALRGLSEKLALSEEAKQYQRMQGFFRRALEYLDPLIKEGAIEDARAILLEVGKESLRENGDWVLLHRARPMEMPAGG